jgi:phosphomevalonate kinase
MSVNISVSAPGKLVLTGEYAVLEGAPAVSAAVDVRAQVDITASTNHALHVVNSGEQFVFVPDENGALSWQQDPGSYAALVEAAFPLITAAGREIDAFTVSIDTRDFFITSESGAMTKTGVGSSAAVAVSLTAAFQLLVGDQPSLEKALEVHARFQQQQGSGIDVVNSWLGGLISKTSNTITTLAWPEGLHVLAVSTGIAAATTDRLKRLEEFNVADPQAYKKAFDELGYAANNAAQSWQGGSAEDVLESVRNYAVALEGFGAAAGLDIWSEPHRKIAEIAARYGVVYKPSGAGGGDFGVAFTCDDAALGNFATETNLAGYQIARFGWSETGIKVRKS